MSSASMNGSGTSPIGSASRPARTGSSHRSSVKFWKKLFGRRIVHSAPDSRTAASAAAIPAPNSKSEPTRSSPRPDSTTNRRTPAATASAVNGFTGSGSSGATRYTADAPATAGPQVPRSSQSNAVALRRDAARTGTPASASRRTTRRPVFPVAPSTRTSPPRAASLCVFFSLSSMAPSQPGTARRRHGRPSGVHRRGCAAGRCAGGWSTGGTADRTGRSAAPMGRTEYYRDPEAPRANTLIPASNLLVTDDRGALLLQRRRDTGQWALPGGAQDIGATAAECAVRECEEGTGVRAEVTGFLGVSSDPEHIVAYTDGEIRQQYEAVYTGRPVSGEPRPTAEADAVRWVLPAELDGLDIHPSMRRQIDDHLSGTGPHPG